MSCRHERTCCRGGVTCEAETLMGQFTKKQRFARSSACGENKNLISDLRRFFLAVCLCVRNTLTCKNAHAWMLTWTMRQALRPRRRALRTRRRAHVSVHNASRIECQVARCKQTLVSLGFLELSLARKQWESTAVFLNAAIFSVCLSISTLVPVQVYH